MRLSGCVHSSRLSICKHSVCPSHCRHFVRLVRHEHSVRLFLCSHLVRPIRCKHILCSSCFRKFTRSTLQATQTFSSPSEHINTGNRCGEKSRACNVSHKSVCALCFQQNYCCCLNRAVTVEVNKMKNVRRVLNRDIKHYVTKTLLSYPLSKRVFECKYRGNSKL